jgi:hypothetical protein
MEMRWDIQYAKNFTKKFAKNIAFLLVINQAAVDWKICKYNISHSLFISRAVIKKTTHMPPEQREEKMVE